MGKCNCLVRQSDDTLDLGHQGGGDPRPGGGEAGGASVGHPGLDEGNGECRLHAGDGSTHRDEQSIGRCGPDVQPTRGQPGAGGRQGRPGRTEGFSQVTGRQVPVVLGISRGGDIEGEGGQGGRIPWAESHVGGDRGGLSGGAEYDRTRRQRRGAPRQRHQRSRPQCGSDGFGDGAGPDRAEERARHHKCRGHDDQGRSTSRRTGTRRSHRSSMDHGD